MGRRILFRRHRAGFQVEVSGADPGIAGQPASGVARGRDAEFAAGVGVGDVALQDAALYQNRAPRGQAFGIEGRRAEAADAVVDHGAIVDDRDVFAGDALAEHLVKEGCVAIDGVAVGGLKDVAHNAACDLWREDHGHSLSFDAACAQAAECALRGNAADLFRVA